MLTRRNFLKAATAGALIPPLSACVESSAAVEFHRNTTRPISSITRFDTKRFAGRWVIRGEFTHPGEPPLFGSVTFEHSAGDITGLVIQNKVGGRSRFDAELKSRARVSVGKAPYDTQYWVLWVDADYRTAAIGTPSGSFGWVIDRSPSGGADRIQAAKDVLSFNGYDMSRFHVY